MQIVVARKRAVIPLLVLLFADPSIGQTTGHLKGKITDNAGGAIEKSHFIAVNASGRFEGTADDSGAYVLELPAGSYDVSTTPVAGFLPLFRSRIQIKSGEETILNARLKVTLGGAICVLDITSEPRTKGVAERKKRKD